MKPVDAIVVGAGFGGLGAALRLAERGQSVRIFERLDYPGGCACTFEHEGDRFEGGATLFAGFERGQLFERWIREHRMAVGFDLLESPVQLRAPGLALSARRDRDRMRSELEDLPQAPRERLRRFFALQRRVADALWAVFDDPRLLPPLDLRRVARHALRAPRYLPLARLVGKSLSDVLERYGLDGYEPLRVWLEAQCRITIQCGVDEAEAPFALAALDYHHRGAAHVHGGVGELAQGMTRAIENLGSEVHLRSPVRRAWREDGGWRVLAGGEVHAAPALLLNMLPQDAARILDVPPAGLTSMTERVARGWGACALYRTLRPPLDAPESAFHLELVADPERPFLEGNHVFLSVGAAGEGVRDTALRRATASTHVRIDRLRDAEGDEQARYVGGVQERMRATIRALAPEWSDVVRELTASPRTFRRWTGRAEGLVGGVPRLAGLGAYDGLFARPLAPGLQLVGDSVFPGQSILAAALGGVRAAERVSPRLLRASAPRDAAARAAVAPAPLRER